MFTHLREKITKMNPEERAQVLDELLKLISDLLDERSLKRPEQQLRPLLSVCERCPLKN